VLIQHACVSATTSKNPNQSNHLKSNYSFGQSNSETNAKVTTLPQFDIAQAGEQLETDYSVHELPGSSVMEPEECRLINQALLTRLELLESEKKKMDSKKDKQFFHIQDIQHDDKLVQFYTGFTSFTLFLAFFELLGPAVHHLNYWGSKAGLRKVSPTQKNRPKEPIVSGAS